MRERLAAVVLALALAACEPAGQPAGGPLGITRGTICALDGMLLADYAGPHAQIHYRQGEPEFFCDPTEMFALYLVPEQARRVTGLYVQDMGSTDWERPEGHWIDARDAWYVHGSSRHGAMGPTLAPFAREADARDFAQRYGGRLLRFDDVTPDLVALDGGALHDQTM